MSVTEMDDETSHDDDARLRALGDKLRARETPREDASHEAPGSNMAIGMKYASEFAGAVLVTTLVGYFIDKVAGSSPFGLLGGLFLGTVAGVYAMVKSARNGMD